MRSKLILALFLIFLVVNSALSVLFKLPSTEKSPVTSPNEENNNEVKVSSSNNDFALTLKFEPPPSFPDDGYFTYDTYNPNTEASLVTSFDTSGYIGDTIAADDAYYIGHIDANEYAFSVSSDDKIDEGYWYLYFRASIPASYLGTISVKYKVRMTIEGGDALQFIYTDTFDATADYIINGHIYLEIKAKFYDKASYWEGEYYDDFEIDTFVYLMKWDGTKVLVASHDNDDQVLGTDDSTEGVKDCYLMVDQVKLTTTYYYSNVIPLHTTTDNYVLHKVQFEVSYAGTKVTFLNLPRNWVFYNSSPTIDWNDTEKSFYAIIEGTYTLYFVSYDFWNYPQYELSRVAFFNSRGEFLNFDSFHTYIAESPTRLIRYAPDINDPDLVCWFRFNEGSGDKTYDWKQGLEGTIHGATWVTGYIGKALSFDGSDDYVEVSDNDLLDISDAITIEAWIYPTSESSVFQGIVAKYEWSADQREYELGLKDGKVRFLTSSDGTTSTEDYLDSPYELTLFQWYHVVAVFDGNYKYLYINGKMVAKKQWSNTIFKGTSPLWIGRSDGTQFYNGIIDEVRIYKRALTPEEIWWHYAIVFYYDGYRDLMGREFSKAYRDITQGLFGYTSIFDGLDDRVLYSQDTSMTNSKGSITLISVVYVEQIRWSGILAKGAVGYGALHYELYLGSDGVFRFAVKVSGRSQYSVHSSIIVEPNKWYVIAGIFSGDSLMIYVNGVIDVLTFSTVVHINYQYSSDLYIGDDIHAKTQPFSGMIDEAIVLRESLSKEMLDNLYYIAKQYIGGYYTDESFRATWDIEMDSPEDGHGFSEDFSDISEWHAGDGASLSTNGDILNVSDTDKGYFSARISGLSIDTDSYPFLEVRVADISDGLDYLYIWLYDGTNGYFLYIDPPSTGIFRWNIKEKTGGATITEIRLYGRDDATNGFVCWDWIRIYRIEGYEHYTWSADEYSWLSSVGGTLIIYEKFTKTTNRERNGIYYDVNPATKVDVIEVRLRGETTSSNMKIGIIIKDGSGTFHDYYIDIPTEWTTIRITDDYLKTSGIDDLYIALVECAKDDATGDGILYIDYVRIGYLQEKIHDTEWQPLLYPLYEHPKYGYVWFNVTDIWGNQLAYEPRPYQPYQDFIFQVYSWKFKNARDDTFVKITLQQEGSGFYYSEWIGPGELTEYILYPGTYYLDIYYPLTDETSSYTITINDDTYFLLTGYTLADIINNQEEIMNQIVSVNITLLNVNSTIMNQVIDVNINVVNMNVTLFDMIVDVQNQITNLNATILQMNETLYNEILNVNGTIVSMLIDVQNDIISINTTILQVELNLTNKLDAIESFIAEVNATLYDEIVSSNATIISMIVDVQDDIVAVNTTMGTYYTDLSGRIDLVESLVGDINVSIINYINATNSNISAMLIDIENDIFSLNSTMELYYVNLTSRIDVVNSTLGQMIVDVQNTLATQNVTIYEMWADLENQIVAVNTSLGLMIIDLQNNITVMNTTIVDMLVNITDNIVLVQNDIYALNETIILKFRDLDNNITQYFTTTWDKIATLDEMIRRFFNRFTWELYNPLTGLGIESELFRVYINDRRVFQHEYYTLADNVSIIVTDYWDRVWYNASHPANASIKIGIPVGRLIIYNDLDKDITVNITLKDDPQKRNITIVILKGTAVVLDLPLGDYYITVISIDYKTLKVELRTLLVSVALSDTGKEVVISQPEIHVDEGFWGKIKEEAPSYILHGFLFGLGSIAASLIFAAIWLTEKRRKQAEISLGTGPIRYSYQVTVTWKDIILITLLIICALLIYLLLI